MRRISRNVIWGGLAAVFVVGCLMASPATAGFVGRSKQTTYRQSDPTVTLELAAQTKRPRVTIYRRRAYLGPNAVRQCRSWLVTEYRISGPVIVPQMHCWWE